MQNAESNILSLYKHDLNESIRFIANTVNILTLTIWKERQSESKRFHILVVCHFHDITDL